MDSIKVKYDLKLKGADRVIIKLINNDVITTMEEEFGSDYDVMEHTFEDLKPDTEYLFAVEVEHNGEIYSELFYTIRTG